jgi:hypothetical protein
LSGLNGVGGAWGAGPAKRLPWVGGGFPAALDVAVGDRNARTVLSTCFTRRYGSLVVDHMHGWCWRLRPGMTTGIWWTWQSCCWRRDDHTYGESLSI